MTDEKKAEIPKEIAFHYVKSNYYRVVHADGAHGGLTTRGFIQINFFSERTPLPTQTVQPVKDEHTLGEELRDRRVVKEGVEREFEVGVILDLNAAKSVLKWLQDKVDTHEELTQTPGGGES